MDDRRPSHTNVRHRRRLKGHIPVIVGVVTASLLCTMTPANAVSKTTESYQFGTAATTFTNTTSTFKWEGVYEFAPNGNYVYSCNYNETTRLAIDGNGSATGEIFRQLDDLAVKFANTYLPAKMTDADKDFGNRVSFRMRYDVDYSSQVTCPDPTYEVKVNGGTDAQREAVGTGVSLAAGIAAATAVYMTGGLYDYTYGTNIIGTSQFEAAAGCIIGLFGLQAFRDVRNVDKLPWYDWLLKCSGGAAAFAGYGKISRVFGTAASRDAFFQAIGKGIGYAYGTAQSGYYAAKNLGQNMWTAIERIYNEWRQGRLGRRALKRPSARLHSGV